MSQNAQGARIEIILLALGADPFGLCRPRLREVVVAHLEVDLP